MQWIKAAKRVAEMLNKQAALIALIGPRGTGKTQMAVEMIREWCRAGNGALYCRAMDFFMDIKDSYHDAAVKTERAALNGYILPSLLVMDEVHVRGATAWEANMLTYLMDRRYAGRLRTLIISNLTGDDLVASLGDSIADRLAETGGVIECAWTSFREGGHREHAG